MEINAIQLAADWGDADAQYNLGVMYHKGDGVPQDYAQAAKWFRLAADQGFAQAQFNLGVMYFNGDGVRKNYAQAVKWYRLAADQGYALAQSNLGVMYAKGQGVPQDAAQTVKWLRRAADQGFAQAQFNLGYLYATGDSAVSLLMAIFGKAHLKGHKKLPYDSVQAAKWYRLAADQGHASAQYSLGAMYETGQGVRKNYVQAAKWLNLAAAQRDVDGMEGRDLVAKLMTPQQIAQAQELARNWKSKR